MWDINWSPPSLHIVFLYIQQHTLLIKMMHITTHCLQMNCLSHQKYQVLSSKTSCFFIRRIKIWPENDHSSLHKHHFLFKMTNLPLFIFLSFFILFSLQKKDRISLLLRSVSFFFWFPFPFCVFSSFMHWRLGSSYLEVRVSQSNDSGGLPFGSSVGTRDLLFAHAATHPAEKEEEEEEEEESQSLKKKKEKTKSS